MEVREKKVRIREEASAQKIQAISRGRKARVRAQERQRKDAQRRAAEVEAEALEQARRGILPERRGGKKGAKGGGSDGGSVASVLAAYDARVGTAVPAELRSALLRCHTAMLSELDLCGIDLAGHLRLLRAVLKLPQFLRLKLRKCRLGALEQRPDDQKSRKQREREARGEAEGGQGVLCVGEAMLARQFFLRAVDIRDNDLNLAGAVAVARSLKEAGGGGGGGTVLDQLGICKLAQPLPLKQLRAGELTELRVAGSMLGPGGAIVLAAVLALPTLFLTALDVSNNGLGAAGKRALSTACRRRSRR